MIKKILSIGLLSTLLVSANDFEAGFNINDTELEGFFSGYLKNAPTLGNSDTKFKYLIEGLNSDEFNRGSVGFLSENRIEPIQGSVFGIGLKYNYISMNGVDYSQIPIIATFRYYLPELMYNIPPVAVDIQAEYAPKVMSFQDSEGYRNLRVEGSLEPIENVNMFLGYRTGTLKTETTGNQDLSDSVYGGLKFRF